VWERSCVDKAAHVFPGANDKIKGTRGIVKAPRVGMDGVEA